MNRVHATAIVAADAVLGDGNVVGAHAVIHSGVVLGDDNWIGSGVVLGAPPEIRSFPHPRDDGDSWGAGVVIGSGNTIREHAQIHQGSSRATTVGDGAFLMNQSYVAHDCRLGDGVTLASSVLLAGHVTIGARANLGLGTSVHQFRTVGAGAMVGMGSVVTHDVPAFAKAFGVPLRVAGVNSVGLERAGVPAEDIAVVVELLSAGTAPAEADLPAAVQALLW